MQIDHFLNNELQLGNQLSVCVKHNRRSEFSLLLAMISHDALDFSQFKLPKTDKQNAYSDQSTDLRSSLGAGPEQPLAADPVDFLIGEKNAFTLAEQQMQQLKLSLYLAPEPLAIRDDSKYIPSNIMENCELAVRKRNSPSNLNLSEVQMDAVAFYDNLQNPLQHQTLTVTQV